MGIVVLVCGNVFDGISDSLTGPVEILVEGKATQREFSPHTRAKKLPRAAE